MNKLILLILVYCSTSYGATVWKPAGYWFKEVTPQGSVRFSKMTDAQVKNLCTIPITTAPLTTIMGSINDPVPYTVGTRETTNPFGGFEAIPKLDNGDCYAVKDSKIYNASQVGANADEVICPSWK